jgi:hypothetical protein
MVVLNVLFPNRLKDNLLRVVRCAFGVKNTPNSQERAVILSVAKNLARLAHSDSHCEFGDIPILAYPISVLSLSGLNRG